ncbi:MAG: CZB domain-containing protein [Magnetococcales bacterium]|nr:CZB domain-containing protein [Magnetococcales bacterium]
MSSNPKLDLGLARIAHLNWEYEMESATKGSSISLEAQSHEDCELGRWLNGPAQRNYGALESIQPLLVAHKAFHQAASRLAIACNDGGEKNISQELETVRRLSRDIIFHLTEMELEALEKSHITTSNARQPRSLFQRLFAGPYHALPEDKGTLKVSQARLIHLRWERNLMEAFRHRGKDITLESSEICALGVWINATGVKRYSDLPEIAKLDETHKAFHTHAKNVISALRNKQDKRAEASYKQTREFSRRVIYLLSAIEYKLLDSDNVQSTDSFLDLNLSHQ